MAQYMLCGMLVKPFSAPSIMYIIAPTINTTVITVKMKIRILGRLARRAVLRRVPSVTKCASFSTRKTRSSRSARITMRLWVPVKKTLR